ncbi:hypothetical protein [Erwinia sp. V71]|uniref:hypothetical protein n=1 Tax=Erwinia sp. V71 TaxID=3369424 RepID=UPI003F63897D
MRAKAAIFRHNDAPVSDKKTANGSNIAARINNPLINPAVDRKDGKQALTSRLKAAIIRPVHTIPL